MGKIKDLTVRLSWLEEERASLVNEAFKREMLRENSEAVEKRIRLCDRLIDKVKEKLSKIN